MKKSFVLFTWLGAMMLLVMLIATPLLRADSSQGVPGGVIVLLLVLMAIQVSFSSLAGHIASLISMKYYDLTDTKMEEVKDTIRERRIELHVEEPDTPQAPLAPETVAAA